MVIIITTEIKVRIIFASHKSWKESNGSTCSPSGQATEWAEVSNIFDNFIIFFPETHRIQPGIQAFVDLLISISGIGALIQSYWNIIQFQYRGRHCYGWLSFLIYSFERILRTAEDQKTIQYRFYSFLGFILSRSRKKSTDAENAALKSFVEWTKA